MSRNLADIICTSFAIGRRGTQAQWFAGIALALIASGTGLTALMEYRGITDLGCVLNAAYVGGFAMAVYTPLLLWINLRHLPRAARPLPVNVVMVGAAAAIYIGHAVTSVRIDRPLTPPY